MSARVTVIVVALVVAACGARRAAPATDGLQLAARLRAAADLDCPANGVAARMMSRGRYHVRACGAEVVYDCSHRAGPATCALAEDQPPSRSREGTWTDADVGDLVARLNAGLAQCLVPGRADLRLWLALTPAGAVRRISMDDETSSCVDRHLRRARLPGTMLGARIVQVRVRGDGDHGLGEPDDPVGPLPEHRRLSPAEAARRIVEDEAPSLLECTTASTLELQVSWDSAGRLDAFVVTPADRMVEACVRARLQRLSIPPARSPGTLTQALRR